MNTINEIITSRLAAEAAQVEASLTKLSERQNALAVALEQLKQINALSEVAVQQEMDQVMNEIAAVEKNGSELLSFKLSGDFAPHAYARVLLDLLAQSLSPEELYALVEALVDSMLVQTTAQVINPEIQSEKAVGQKESNSVSSIGPDQVTPVVQEDITTMTPILFVRTAMQGKISHEKQIAKDGTEFKIDWNVIEKAVGQRRSTLTQRIRVMLKQLNISTSGEYGGFTKAIATLIDRLKFGHMEDMFPRDVNHKMYQETLLTLLIAYDSDAQGGYLQEHVPLYAKKALGLINSVASSKPQNLYAIHINNDEPLIKQLHARIISLDGNGHAKQIALAKQVKEVADAPEESFDHYPDPASFTSIEVRADVIRWIQQHGLKAQQHADRKLNEEIKQVLDKIVSFFRGEHTNSVTNAIKMYTPARTGKVIVQVRKGKFRVEFIVLTTEEGVKLEDGVPYARSNQDTRFKS